MKFASKKDILRSYVLWARVRRPVFSSVWEYRDG
jgi:hypothetical protein